MDRPSQTYRCQCKGCGNGEGSAFAAAPEEWFTSRGMTPPKNCPDCRQWVKAQTDEARRCKSCNRVIRIPAKYKISHHKREGVYIPLDQCSRCKRGKPQPKGSKKWSQERKDYWEKTDFNKLPSWHEPSSYPVDTNPNSYYHPISSRSRQTRKEHIERHTEWSPYSMTKSSGGDRTPTALARHAQDLDSLLRSVNIATQSQVGNRVREYVDQTGDRDRIVRLTLTDSARIEVTIIESIAGTNGHEGHELVTTYEITLEEVESKLRSKWR